MIEKLDFNGGNSFEILCEQLGDVEDILKEKLIALFRQSTFVTRAYLVKLLYSGEKNPSVCLCLKVSPDFSENEIKKIMSVFSSIFNEKQFLDIMIIEDKQEAYITKIVKPFFVLESL